MSPVIRSRRLIDVPFCWPGRFAKDNGDLRKDGGEYGELSAAAIDDPSRIRRSRDSASIWAWSPGGISRARSLCRISKCGDRRMRTLLYEVANVMLTRYKGQLKVKLDWAVASPSDPRPEGAHPSGMPPRDHHARAAARRGSCAQMPFIP